MSTRSTVAVGLTTFVAAFGLTFGAHSVLAAPGNGNGNGGGGSSPPQFTVNTTASDVPPNPATAYPGTTGGGALYVKATNRTGMTVQVVRLTAGTITPAACAAGLNASAVTTWLGTNPRLPNKSTVTFAIPGALTLSTTSANGCQGATITVPVSVTVQQVR